MKKILLSVLLIPIILLAGCIQQQAGKTMNGVIIKSFFSEPAKIEPGMTFGLLLIVENVGGAKATGISEATGVSAELMGLTSECEICGNGVCAPVDGVEKQIAVRNQEIAKELWPASPELDATGQEGMASWTITTPETDVGVSYDMTVRLYYSYTTTSESMLRAITMPYYRTFPEKKEGRDWGITFSDVSAGPLTVKINAPTPIVPGESSEPISVWFEIKNVGGGRPFKDGTDKPTLETLDIVDTIVVTDTGNAKCEETEVKLADGESGRLDCTVKPGKIDNYKDIPITLKLRYRYYVDAHSKIEQAVVEKAKYSNDVITVKDYFARPLESHPDDEIKIDFYVLNNGNEPVKNVKVNFFDGLKVFKSYTLNCAGETESNGICEFGDIKSLDYKKVSLILKAPDVESKMDFTVSYSVSYEHSGYREAHIPAIAETEKEPSLKFLQSTPTWGPIVVEFEPPVGRERKEDERTIKEYWTTQKEPFLLKMVFKHVGSGSIGEIKPVNIPEEDVGLKLVDLDPVTVDVQCDFKLVDGEGKSTKDIIILGKQSKESELLCKIKAKEGQAEIKGVAKVDFKYNYIYLRKETFTVNPAL